MAQIGILHGNKESFPQAVLEGLLDRRRGCCRFLCVDALDQGESDRWGWDTPIILDLFSGQMPYLKEALRVLAIDPHRKIFNDPRLGQIHSRATVRRIASDLGLQVPRALLLPAHSTPERFPDKGYINLRYPLAWGEMMATVGPYPHLQAVAFDREPGMVVEDLGALWRRYHDTGTQPQELVEAPRAHRFFRVFSLGNARFVRPLEPLTWRPLLGELPTERESSDLLAVAQKLLAKVPWTMSTWDLGLDGNKVEYVDANPDPYLEWWVLGEHDFSLAVKGTIDMLVTYLS